MAQKNTRQQTIDELNGSVDPVGELYKAKCINWKGTTSDTGEYYTDVIAEQLQHHLGSLKSIKETSRTSSYCPEGHDKITIDLNSNRAEEIFAKRLTYLEFKEGLGMVLDYQIPLKNTNEDKGMGAIDLISYSPETTTLYLIELKYKGNDETLLRAALESFTYFQQVDKGKLIKDVLETHGSALQAQVNPDEVSVKPAVMTVPECNPDKELEEAEHVGQDNRSRRNLQALSLALGIEYFSFDLNMALDAALL